ncbi:MAG: hypothetical protein R3293_17695 [Candidatus Promineifilaceae bacterium]|nr:hypothetical protein [Candidatus Promineifilaceae bacterium]
MKPIHQVVGWHCLGIHALRRIRFVHHQPSDVRGEQCCTQHTVSTERMTQYVNLNANRVHDGRNVLKLPFYGIALSILAIAMTPPVNGIYSKQYPLTPIFIVKSQS